MNSERRLALLFGSTLPMDDSTKPIPSSIRETNLDLMARTLASLGESGFGWPAADGRRAPSRPRIVRNPTRDQLMTALSGVTPGENDLFLLYYFGHGFIGDGGELVLAYKGVDLSRPTAFTLNEVVRELVLRGFARLIIVLDSCHAGLAAPALAITHQPGRFSYYLMAATGGGWSRFDESGGEFTRALARALSYPNMDALRDARRNAVTFAKWFEVAAGLVRSQRPTCDGALGNEVLYPYETPLSSVVNRLAPRTSAYSRLYLLLDVVGEGLHSLDEVHRLIEERGLDSFQTVIRMEDGTVQRVFILPRKVREYLDLATGLGLAVRDGEGGDPPRWSLTPQGKQAIANDGASFNQDLVAAVYGWLPAGVTAKVINDALHELAGRTVLPNVLNVEQRLLELKLPMMKRKELRTALQLLSYAGVVQRATSDTFFPR